jgi:hypothetical protein
MRFTSFRIVFLRGAAVRSESSSTSQQWAVCPATHLVSDVCPFTPKAPKMPHMAKAVAGTSRDGVGSAPGGTHTGVRAQDVWQTLANTSGGASHAPSAAPAPGTSAGGDTRAHAKSGA